MFSKARHAWPALGRARRGQRGAGVRWYRQPVKVPSSDDMMAITYGHQYDVAWEWLRRGTDVCWLGDFGELMEMYHTLDARAEAEWAARHGGEGPKDWTEFVDYVAAKRVFDRLWVPNPISALANAFNEEQFHTWVEEVYPYANFPYLPMSVFASLQRSFRAFSLPQAYHCLGKAGKGVGVRYLHGVTPVPAAYPPVKLLRNYLAQLSNDGELSPRVKQHVLVPNAGNHGALVPLIVSNMGAFRGTVHAIDADAEAVDTILSNHQRLKGNKGERHRKTQVVKAEVGGRVVPRDPFRRFNMAVLCPGWLGDGVDGQDALSGYYDFQAQRDDDVLFTSTFFAGRSGGADVVKMLDEVEPVMNAEAKIIVLWSNLDNLVRATDHHPIVHELETNERYSLHHFEDVPCPLVTETLMRTHGSRFLNELQRKLRAELWVLRVNRPMLGAPPVQEAEDEGLVVREEDGAGRGDALALRPPEADPSPATAAATDDELLRDYFYTKPNQDIGFNYEQTKRKIRLDRRVGVSTPKPSAEGIARQRLVEAQHHERQELRREANIKRAKLKALGLLPKRRRETPSKHPSA
eukprot:TRINITY_DN22246_c0_g1_i1.p1 TRINITY_DN22246_c0_g1~~TRINITY_DN22246_c0_g1_i1.p1  ORF type:complete len:578 (+),score=202.20 TRINITY_DN22246_c0_g1_i1:48-1781(+)